MEKVFKSVLEQDRAPVVICGIDHVIIYMNPVARRVYRRDLTGKSLLDCHNAKSNELIVRVVDSFKAGGGNDIVHTFFNPKENKDVYMVALRDDSGELIAYYEKHEYRTPDSAPFYDLKQHADGIPE